MYKLSLSVLTAFCCSMPIAQADEILDFTPIVRDFVAGGTQEIAVPYIRYNDQSVPADGIPDSITVYFNTFTVGTTTKLHSSLPRTIAVPALPCTNPEPSSISDDTKIKFMGTSSTSRVHLVLTGSVGCWDITEAKWKESFKTLLYSTDAATAANSWYKVWNLDTIAANGVDVTNDGVNELMMTMSVPTATGGENAQVLYVRGSDGAVVFSNDYPVTNRY